MKIKVFYSCVFLFFVSFLFGQNNEKLALQFRYLKDKQSSNSTTTATSTLFTKSIQTHYSAVSGKTEDSFSCIIYTQHPEVLQANSIPLQSIQPTYSVAWLTLEQINFVSTFPEVTFVDTSKKLRAANDISVASSGASLLHSGRLDNTAYKGDGVIIAIIDTGIDWDHLDFRNPSDPKKSRILRIDRKSTRLNSSH